MKGPKSFYGWKIVGIVWFAHFVNVGMSLYGGSVTIPYLLKDMAMSRATLGLGVTLSYFAACCASPLVGWAINKWGLKRVILIGSFMQICGALAQSVMTEHWHYLAIAAISFGFGSCLCCTLPLSTSINLWFTRLRGRTIGIFATAPGVAGIVLAPMVQFYMNYNGGNWREGALFGACWYALSFLTIYFFFKDTPQSIGQFPDGDAEAVPEVVVDGALSSWTIKEVLKTKAFWLIAFCILVTNFAFIFYAPQWILHLRECGITPTNAAIGLGTFTFVSIIGKTVGGWLLDKIPSRVVYVQGMVLVAAAMFFANLISSTVSALATSALLGFGFGFCYVVQVSILANYFGRNNFAQAYGYAIFFGNLIGATGGVVGGKIHDIYNSYVPMFNILIVVLLCGALAAYFAKPPRKEAADTVISQPDGVAV